MANVKTVTITNFAGRLTRFLNGDLNSGFAKFATSWGYDPFTKPANLTWLSDFSDIAGSTINDAVLAGQVISPAAANEEYVYAIGSSSNLYKIDPTNSGAATNTLLYDTPSVLGAIGSIAGTFSYGADIDYYRSLLYISSDNRITTTTPAGASISSVTGTTSVTSGMYHPMIQFQGALYYGNGNNIGKIDSTGIVTNGAVLSPALPTGMFINDLDITPDGTYMIITASYLYPANLSGVNSAPNGANYAVQSYTFLWNGSDIGVTSYQTLPAFPATALTTFMDKRYFFNQDSFGVGLYEGNQKLLTLPNNLAPLPGGATPNGSFLSWASPEGIGTPTVNPASYSSTCTSLYYFGQLDAENPPGLWRMIRKSPSASRFAYRAPFNLMINNSAINLTNVAGYGKQYISVWESNANGSAQTFHFYRFILQPINGGTPTLGVYETQNQLFSKRISIGEIRVYTEPTAANNGFQLDIIGSDGNPITNGTFTYSYVTGTDITQLQGPLERINYAPGVKTVFDFGIRITNTGTTNMTIKKIEVDYDESGK